MSCNVVASAMNEWKGTEVPLSHDPKLLPMAPTCFGESVRFAFALIRFGSLLVQLRSRRACEQHMLVSPAESQYVPSANNNLLSVRYLSIGLTVSVTPIWFPVGVPWNCVSLAKVFRQSKASYLLFSVLSKF